MSTTTAISPAIREFSAAVRAQLDDLSPEEIDDLTDGLEGDLTEQAADAGEEYDLGDPVAYAEELRLAAGLPLRSARRKGAAFDAEKVGRGAADVLRKMRELPTVAALLDFLVALRPVWWVFRGWAVYSILDGPVFKSGSPIPRPGEGGLWLVLLLLVILSVQWGRGRWLPWRWLRVVRIIASVLAVLVSPFLIGYAGNMVSQAQNGAYSNPSDYIPQGLSLNGSEVQNIFAYDAEGQALMDVQLFTQDGEPLVTSAQPQEPWRHSWHADGYSYYLVPSEGAPGRTGWNVFPLNRVDESALNQDGTVDVSKAKPATPPFPQVQPLARDRTATPEPTPVPSVPPAEQDAPAPGADPEP